MKYKAKSKGRRISRRKLLESTAAGLAGMALLPDYANAAKPRLLDPPPGFNWDFALPPGTIIFALPAYANAIVVIPIQNSNAFAGGLLYVDVHTRQTLGPFQPDFFFSSVAVSSNGIVYAATTSGSLLALDLAGNLLWFKSYDVQTQIFVHNNSIIFATGNGSIECLDFQGNELWSVGINVSAKAVALTIVETTAVAAFDQNFVAVTLLDANADRTLWQYQSTGSGLQGTAYRPTIAAGGQNVFATLENSVVIALDVASGKLVWQWPQNANGPAITPPAVHAGLVFVADSVGTFSALNTADGSLSWQISLMGGGGAPFPIFVEDGVAYVTALSLLGDSTLHFVILDLKAALSRVLDAGACCLGVENGISYISHNQMQSIGAVNFGAQAHQFYCESELLVEDYTQSTNANGYQGNNTSYRTHIKMLDQNYNPRSGKAVKVWASDTATLMSGGVTYKVDNLGNSAFLQTDGAGELSLVVDATDLSCPSLYIWSNFMADEECLVIYPDHTSLQTLNAADGTQLSAGTSYDGTSLLPQGYGSADHLASTIKAAMAGGPAAGLSMARKKLIEDARQKPKNMRRARPLPGGPVGGPITILDTRYIAYNSNNIVYQPAQSSADRPYGTPTVPNWSAVFDSNGEVTYTEGIAEIHWGVLLGIKDLITNVVHGIEKVAQIVYTTVDQAVTTIIKTAEHDYQVTITAVEHAVAVVASALKTAVGDIKRAIQWLSHLFNWGSILQMKDNIKSAITGSFTDVTSWIAMTQNSGLAALHSGLQSNSGSAMNDRLNSGDTAFGSGSLQSQQNDSNNPQDVYGQGGATSYTKSRFLSTKVTDNAGKGQLTPQSVQILSTSEDAFVAAVETFFTNSKQTLENNQQFRSIPTDAQTFLSNFAGLLKDPVEFVTNSFHDIILLMKDIAGAVVAFADALIEAFLTLLQTVIQYLLDFLNAEIQIPVVSDLWNLISKSPLTLLDLAALLIAVPTSIVSQAMNSSSLVNAVGNPFADQKTAWMFAAGFQGFMGSAADLLGQAASVILGRVISILGICSFTLSFPSDLATNTQWSYVYWCFKFVPSLISLYSFSSAPNPAVLETNRIVVGVWGLMMLGYAIGLGVANEPGFRGTNYTTTIKNAFIAMPAICRPLNSGPPAAPNRIALALIDEVAVFTAIGITLLG